MMRLSPFGGGATNERPAVVKASSSDDDTTKCRHKLNTSTKQRCMEDVYKARCSDLERQIVQLKLELAEAKVRICASCLVRLCQLCRTVVIIESWRRPERLTVPSFLAPHFHDISMIYHRRQMRTS